jgi:hypothetical protein
MIHSPNRITGLLLGLLVFSASPSDALGQAVEGKNLLAIGHSFFIPIARELPDHAARAGVVGHTQSEFFSGGESGTPSSLWEDLTKRDEILAILNTGTVDVFAMTYDPDSEGYTEWIDSALAANPNTTIYIGLPWIDYPSDYPTDVYASTWLTAHRETWPDVLDGLRALYPGVEILNLPYGQSTIELRLLFEDGNLPDVTALTGPAATSLFTDYKGHAGQMIKDTAPLVWLGILYGIDLATYDWDHGYATDIRQIAQAIVDEENPPAPGDFWDYKNVSYGPESRQTMNIALPGTPNPSGIFFWAHANGGSPDSLQEPDANAMLESGYAVVSWGSVGKLEAEADVLMGWADAQVVFDHVRANAATWNMDPDNIIIGGRSRGSIVSWPLAQSGHPSIVGIYMYNALPSAVWQEGASWTPDDEVTADAPPTYLVYGPPWGSSDGHAPDNVLPIEAAYDSFGIGGHFTLYQDMWGDFRDGDGNWTNLYQTSHYLPEFVASLGNDSQPGCTDAPRVGCRTAPKAMFDYSNNPFDLMDRLSFKWVRGQATSTAELGDPLATTQYDLCVYGQNGALLVAELNVPPDATKWKAAGSRGFAYKDNTLTASGTHKIVLLGSAADRSKILWRARGLDLPDIPSSFLPIPGGGFPLIVQASASDTQTCFEARFDSSNAIKNHDGRLKLIAK